MAEAWPDVFISASYLELMLKPSNLAMIVLALAAVLISKWPFSLRFSIQNRKNRESRTKQRIKRRWQRAQRHILRGAEKGYEAVPAAAAAWTDAETKPSAPGGGSEPGPQRVEVAGKGDVPKESAVAVRARPVSSITSVAMEAAQRKAEHRIFRNLDYELVKRDNMAMAISYTSFVAAICIALSGSRTDVMTTTNALEQVLEAGAWASGSIIMLLIGNILNDKVLLHSVSNARAVMKGNTAVAIAEGAGFLATAIITRSSVSGEGTEFPLDDVYSSLIFFGAGQLCLLASVFMLPVLTGISYTRCREATQKGNITAALKIANVLLTTSLILATPIKHSESLLLFGVCFTIGMLLLAVMNWVVIHAVLPAHSTRREVDNNQWAFALLEAVIGICLGFAADSFFPVFQCA